jgi:tRNA threonylcarbamoyladenosine biosynthesis protein TsaE
MNAAVERRELAQTPEQTRAWGARLAHALPAGADWGVAYLSGELGVGKTTLARGFLAALGLEADARSPTYTLLECYPLGQRTVVHVDLYRLDDPAEIEALGLRDLACPGHLWLVEWPERGVGHLPPADVRILITIQGGGHLITAVGQSELGRRWLSGI